MHDALQSTGTSARMQVLSMLHNNVISTLLSWMPVPAVRPITTVTTSGRGQLRMHMLAAIRHHVSSEAGASFDSTLLAVRRRRSPHNSTPERAA